MRALLVLLLVGCAQVPEVRVTKVPEPPVIIAPEKPDIPDGTPPSEVVRLVRLYILSLEESLSEALKALEVYRQPRL